MTIITADQMDADDHRPIEDEDSLEPGLLDAALDDDDDDFTDDDEKEHDEDAEVTDDDPDNLDDPEDL